MNEIRINPCLFCIGFVAGAMFMVTFQFHAYSILIGVSLFLFIMLSNKIIYFIKSSRGSFYNELCPICLGVVKKDYNKCPLCGEFAENPF